MANGFGEAFGSAYARSLQMTREEYEKEREKDRRQALLLQLVGAPIASGITKGVAGLISEPFKEPVANFFSQEPGRNLAINNKKHDNITSYWRDYEEARAKSGMDPLQYEGKKLQGISDPLIDAAFGEFYGPDFKKQSSYEQVKSDVYDLIYRPEGGFAKKELDETERAKTAVEAAKTPAQKSALIKKHNPNASGPIQAFVRLVRRALNRESFPDYAERKTNYIADQAGLNPTELNAYRDIVREGVTSDSAALIEKVKEILSKRLDYDPNRGVYSSSDPVARLEIDRRYRELDEIGLYSRGISGQLEGLQQEAFDNAAANLPEANFKAQRMPMGRFKNELNKILGEGARDFETKEQQDLIAALRGQELYVTRRNEHINTRVKEEALQPFLQLSDPDRAKAAQVKQDSFASEFDVAADSAFQAAVRMTQNQYYIQRRAAPANQLPFVQDMLQSAGDDNTRRAIFKEEVLRKYDYLLENNIITKAIKEGEGTGRKSQIRTNIFFQESFAGELNTPEADSHSSKPENKVATPETYLGNMATDDTVPKKKLQQFQGFDSVKNIVSKYRNKGNVNDLLIELQEVERNFVDLEGSRLKQPYTYDPDQFLYPKDSVLYNIKNGIPFTDPNPIKEPDAFPYPEDKGSTVPVQTSVKTTRRQRKRRTPKQQDSLLSKPAATVDSSISEQEMADIDSQIEEQEQERLQSLIPKLADRIVQSNSFLRNNRSIEGNLDFEFENFIKRNPDSTLAAREAYKAAIELAKRILKERI